MRERSPDGTQVVIDGKGVGHGILYPLDWFDQNAERQGLPEPIELPAAVVAELLAANMQRSPDRERDDRLEAA